MTEYLVIIEKAGKSDSACVPDLPGCIATGKTAAAARFPIRAEMAFHIEGLREDGLPVPTASARGAKVGLAEAEKARPRTAA